MTPHAADLLSPLPGGSTNLSRIEDSTEPTAGKSKMQMSGENVPACEHLFLVVALRCDAI
jgi:hypothetical protein